MPTPTEVDTFDMAETTEWIVTNLCSDVRCRGDRPYRLSITRLNQVELEACVLTLNEQGLRRPVTIPLADVWQVAWQSLNLTNGTVAIRWRPNVERDAWFLEDRGGRSSNGGWQAEPGSAIFLLRVGGSQAADGATGIARVLQRAVDLCQSA